MSRYQEPTRLDIVSGLLKAGVSQKTIARAFRVSETTVSKWKRSMPEHAVLPRLRKNVRERAREAGVNYSTVIARLGCGLDLETALAPGRRQRPASELRKRAKELVKNPDCAVSEKTLFSRLRRGWNDEEAVLTAAGAW